MRKILIIILIFSLTLVSHDKIKLTIGEWPPFFSDKIAKDGKIAMLISEVFMDQDLKVEYGFFPWKRSMVLAERGKWDGTAAWSRNPEREKSFYFSDDPLYHTYIVFFHKEDYRFDWKDMSDLEGHKIGTTLSYFYGKEFNKAKDEGKLNIDEITSDINNFKKLAKGRIDLFVCELAKGKYMLDNYLTKEERQGIVYHPKFLNKRGYYLLISKKSKHGKEFIDKFNKGIKEFRQSKRYKLLFNDGN